MRKIWISGLLVTTLCASFTHSDAQTKQGAAANPKTEHFMGYFANKEFTPLNLEKKAFGPGMRVTDAPKSLKPNTWGEAEGVVSDGTNIRGTAGKEIVIHKFKAIKPPTTTITVTGKLTTKANDRDTGTLLTEDFVAYPIEKLGMAHRYTGQKVKAELEVTFINTKSRANKLLKMEPVK